MRSIMRLLLPLLLAAVLTCCAHQGEEKNENSSEKIKLPEPSKDEKKSLERTLSERRSIRDYSNDNLTIKELSQLLWSAQGITDPRGFRTAPSAGALYPLEIFVVAGRVDGLEPGIYRYYPSRHEIIRVVEGDRREELSKAAVRTGMCKKCSDKHCHNCRIRENNG